MRKFNPVMYVKHKWLSGCAEISALLDPLVQSYNIPSPCPTIMKSHEPPLPHNILYLIFCKAC